LRLDEILSSAQIPILATVCCVALPVQAAWTMATMGRMQLQLRKPMLPVVARTIETSNTDFEIAITDKALNQERSGSYLKVNTGTATRTALDAPRKSVSKYCLN
jgi:hypothetical protein